VHGLQCGHSWSNGGISVRISNSKARFFDWFPCFIYYNRVFQLLTKVWSGCYYLAAPRALGFSQLKCEFLFRWFLLGRVLDDDELQLTLAFTLKYCARIPLPQTAWGTLKEFFMFACQQGRLEQPWGVKCVRWIQSHRLCRRT
jgi:hypothetical protein